MKEVKDIAYNYIEMPEYISMIVDTPEFERLRHLRELGAVGFVYPSATHTRFEHSLGVYHLTHLFLKHLQEGIPKALTPHIVKLVEIAALVHDIGHGPFSHLYEQIQEAAGLGNSSISHEEVGCTVFRTLAVPLEKELRLNDTDIDIICSLICGEEPDNPVFKHYYFLNQIVSNPVNGLDTDRLDYLARDTLGVGLGLSFNALRILKCQSIFKYSGRYYLSYNQKSKFDIVEVYHSRYILNKIMYNHPKVLAFDQLIIDIFAEAVLLKIIDLALPNTKDSPPDDRMLFLIESIAMQPENVKSQKFERLHVLLEYLNHHRAPRLIFEAALTEDSPWVFEDSRAERARAFKREIEEYSGISGLLFEVEFSDISYGVRGQNPLDFMPVHNKNEVHVPPAFALKYGNSVAQGDYGVITTTSSESTEASAFTELESPVKQADTPNVRAVERLHSDLLMPERFRESGLFVYIYPHNYTKEFAAQLKKAILEFLRRNDLLTPENALELSGIAGLCDEDCFTDRTVSPELPGPMDFLRKLKEDEM